MCVKSFSIMTQIFNCLFYLVIYQDGLLGTWMKYLQPVHLPPLNENHSLQSFNNKLKIACFELKLQTKKSKWRQLQVLEACWRKKPVFEISALNRGCRCHPLKQHISISDFNNHIVWKEFFTDQLNCMVKLQTYTLIKCNLIFITFILLNLRNISKCDVRSRFAASARTGRSRSQEIY